MIFSGSNKFKNLIKVTLETLFKEDTVTLRRHKYPILYLFSYFFFLIGANIAGRTARDVYFLSSSYKQDLSQVMAYSALALGVFVFINNRLSGRLKLSRLIEVSLLFSALSLIVFNFFLKGIGIPALYIWMEVINTLLGVHFWLLAGNIFYARQARKYFGIISAGGSIAGILFGIVLVPFINKFGSSYLLLLTSFFLFASILFGRLLRPYIIKDTSIVPELIKKKKFGRSFRNLDSYSAVLILLLIPMAMATTIVDYQFKMLASTAFPSPNGMAEFFGMFYSVTSFLALAIQLLLTSWILNRFGLISGLLALPVLLIFGSSAMLLIPIFSISLLLKSSDQIFKFTLNNASMQLAWLPMSSAKKKILKPFIDGFLKNLFQGIAGLLIYFSANYISIKGLSWVSLGLIIFWIFAAFFLRHKYRLALTKALETRHFDFDEIPLNSNNPHIIRVLRKALLSKEAAKQAYVLELLENISPLPWKDTLKNIFPDADLLIKQQILKVAAKHLELFSDQDILEQLKQKQELSNTLCLIAAKKNIAQAYPVIKNYLEDDDLKIKAAAAASILLLKGKDQAKAKIILNNMSKDPREREKIIALKSLSGIPEIFQNEQLQKNLIRFIKNKYPRVRLIALEIAKQTEATKELLDASIHCLDNSLTARAAEEILHNFNLEQVVSHSLKIFKSTNISSELQQGIIYMLRDYTSSEVVNFLLQLLDTANIPAFKTSIDSLFHIAKQKRHSLKIIQKLNKKNMLLIKKVYEKYMLIHLTRNDEKYFLFVDHLKKNISLALPIILNIGIMENPIIPVKDILFHIRTGDAAKWNAVFELLDNVFSHYEREIITPILDNSSLEQKIVVAQKHFKVLPRKPEKELLHYLYGGEKWYSLLALDYYIQEHICRKDLSKLKWKQIIPNELNREVLSSYYYKDPNLFTKNLDEKTIQTINKNFIIAKENLSMFTILEKTIILKGIALFENVSGEDLSYLSRIAREISLEKGDTLFEQGDTGDSLYIIVSGKISIHAGEKEIATLEKGDFLGEMALLDRESRSASASALEYSQLLKIDQESFYEIMSSRIEIMQAIMKMLTQRLRNLINS